MKTTQTTKPATKPATKAATKAAQTPAKAETKAPKAETKAAETKAQQTPATPFYPALLAACLAGKFGDLAKAYYRRANQYHAKAGTAFPRSRNAGTIAAMLGEGQAKAKAKAEEIVSKAAKGILPPGCMEGQALFDLMKSGADLPKA